MIIGDDIIKITFHSNNNFKNEFICISRKAPINDILKMYMKKIRCPENLMGEKIIFLFNGDKIDIKSQKTLEELGLIDGSYILVIDKEKNIKVSNEENDENNIIANDQEDITDIFKYSNHYFIRLSKLKKNICIFHNKNLILNCIQCKMEICDECKSKHLNHTIEKIDNKNLELKEDYMEFEKIIINNENKKREILNKLHQNIIYLENCLQINKDELNNVIKKLLTKFYKDIKIWQNLLFFSKILFDSYIRNGKNKKQYKSVIYKINEFFSEEKIKEYNLSNF